jgi:ribonuclease III
MASKRLNGKALAAALEAIAGLTFRDHDRLRRALTHASARDKDAGTDYERMEFLGDRVLGLAVAEFLYKTFPAASEGELSLRLNAMVNAETLASISEEIGLPELINTGSEMRSPSGRKRVNLRADALESLIAAIYLEGGLDAARSFIARHWFARSSAVGEARRDPKTELQEWAHQVGGGVPVYSIDGREGPDHDPVFTISVRLSGFEPATGSGRTKRQAEQAAALAILAREGVLNQESSE